HASLLRQFLELGTISLHIEKLLLELILRRCLLCRRRCRAVTVVVLRSGTNNRHKAVSTRIGHRRTKLLRIVRILTHERVREATDGATIFVVDRGVQDRSVITSVNTLNHEQAVLVQNRKNVLTCRGEVNKLALEMRVEGSFRDITDFSLSLYHRRKDAWGFNGQSLAWNFDWRKGRSCSVILSKSRLYVFFGCFLKIGRAHV